MHQHEDLRQNLRSPLSRSTSQKRKRGVVFAVVQYPHIDHQLSGSRLGTHLIDHGLKRWIDAWCWSRCGEKQKGKSVTGSG
jgi:hypothetical protein